jgi:hypothetical protein
VGTERWTVSPQASIMTGTVQNMALEGRPGPRPWRRGREVRASPEDLQELLLPTPLEMHKVGAEGGHRRSGLMSWGHRKMPWTLNDPALNGLYSPPP